MKVNELFESKTGNPSRGYHGEWKTGEGDSKFKEMVALVRKLTNAGAKEVTHYLDSVHGRHLADIEKNGDDLNAYITKDFKRFMKRYNPEHF